MNNNFKLSVLDKKILDALQENARQSNQDIADKVGSSASSVWRRIKAMEDMGVIMAYRLHLAPEKIGLMETILLHVSLTQHGKDNTKRFMDTVLSAPQVLECYATTGEHDYVLKVLAADMRSYHKFLEEIIMNKPYVLKTHSNVVMRKLKDSQAVPSRIMP